MTPLDLLLGWLDRGILIGLEGDRLTYDAPVSVLTDADFAILRSRKPELIRYMRGERSPPVEGRTEQPDPASPDDRSN